MNMESASDSSSVLQPLYFVRQGCFHYYRDHDFEPLPRFRDLIERFICLSLAQNKNSKAFLLNNDAEEGCSEPQISFFPVEVSDIANSVALSDFGTGWSVFAFADSMNDDLAKKIWIRVVQCKMENQSPDAELFGDYETISITGDSNIIVWTNQAPKETDIKMTAFESEYCVMPDDLSAFHGFHG